MTIDRIDGEAVRARLGHAIKRAEQVMISEKTRALRELGITVPQYAAMYALAAFPGSSGAHLARECFVTPQAMATVLATLESKGFVTRKPSDVHSRVLVTRLTRPGRAMLQKANDRAVVVEQRMLDAFSPQEAAQLRALLERVISALSH